MSDDTKPPVEAKTRAQRNNGRHDVLTHRIIVLSLGATVILTGLNMTILQVLGKEAPPALANIGATAIGALAMALATIMRGR